MSPLPVALELYSVRHDLKRDLRSTLQAVAEMGYEGVEFAGAPEHDPKELHLLLNDLGLTCCGWHTPFDLVQDEKLEETIAFNRVLGNSRIIVPGIPEHLRRTRQDWLELAAFFNQLSQKLAPHGMLTGYHNHRVEFEPLDGERPWDTFFANTDPSVIMQLDTGHAIYAGADPITLLKKYPGRANTIHLKPFSKQAAAEDGRQGFRPVIGQDDTPWKEIFQLCETIGGTQWYIIEYESDAYPPLDAVARCLNGLKSLL